jgi:hypothetical protein
MRTRTHKYAATIDAAFVMACMMSVFCVGLIGVDEGDDGVVAISYGETRTRSAEQLISRGFNVSNLVTLAHCALQLLFRDLFQNPVTGTVCTIAFGCFDLFSRIPDVGQHRFCKERQIATALRKNAA